MSHSAAGEALAARLPPLMVAAERVATTVAQGVHGRRRAGQGESFWQYRPFVEGDAVGRVDWRQSARGDRHYIRETEWEAAQTVGLWRDGGATMRWRSRGMAIDKVARAELLLLALAALLLRGGERVRLLTESSGHAAGHSAGRGALERIAAALMRDAGGCPAPASVPRHARVVLISDFLAPLAELRALVGGLAAVPTEGFLLQVLDPAEAALPFAGRIRFEGVAREAATIIPRVEGIRDAYAQRLAAQQQGIAAMCTAAGFGYATHLTDAPPEAALLALYAALDRPRR